MSWERKTRISGWSAEHLKVLSGAHKGYFNTQYTPYIEDFFNEVDKKRALIVFKSASQVGKTIAGSVAVMYLIDTDPSEMLIVIPSADGIPTYLKHKFDAFLAGCKKVKDKIQLSTDIDKKRPRNADKSFPGGMLSVIGSSNVKTLTAKYVLLDEVADFAKGTVAMVKERMKTFSGFGGMMIAVSTMEDYEDEISQLYDICEVKKAHFMFCEECKNYFYPLVEHLKYSTKEEYCAIMGIEQLQPHQEARDFLPYIKKTGYIECPHCAAKIDEAQRKKLITKKLNKTFQVIKTSESAIQLTNKNGKDVRVDFYEIDPNPKKDYETVGLDVNSFVSGLVTLSMIIEEKYAAVSAYENLTDSEKIKKFYIGYGNRPFIGKIQEAGKHKDILLLGNGLGRGVLPLNTSFLALNVDTQKDYLVYTLVAIDDMANVHLVDCGELYGANQFATLFDMLRSTYYDSDGEGHGINAYGHDRLGIKERTMAVDQFLAELITDYKMGHDDLGIVYPLMGAPDNRQGKRVWLVNKEFKDSPLSYSLGFNANLAKTLFSEYLMRSVTNIKSELGEKSGLFFVNQDIVNEGLLRERPLATSPEMQLTSEELRYEVKNGKTAAKATWQVVYNGRPNHILDCVSGALSLAYFKELFLFRRSANTL